MNTHLASFSFFVAMTAFAHPIGGLTRPPPEHPFLGVHSILLVAKEEPERRLRGDWEAPDHLMLAYSSEWSNSLVDIVSTALEESDVFLLIPHGETREDVRTWLQEHALATPKIRLFDEVVDTPWVRDYGPLQVREYNGRLVWLDAMYDESRPNDDALPFDLGQRIGVDVETLPVAYDGGAIIGNGTGLCAATLDAFEKGRIDTTDNVWVESLLRQIGCRVLALVPALVGEKTGHVDIFAQFLDSDHIAIASVDHNIHSENAERLDEAARTLEIAASKLGLDLRISRVYMPIGPKDTYFTYLNGVRLKNAFLVPSYEAVDEQEEWSAHEQLQNALGEIPLVPIMADEMIQMSGAIHCVAMGLDEPSRIPLHSRTRGLHRHVRGSY